MVICQSDAFLKIRTTGVAKELYTFPRAPMYDLRLVFNDLCSTLEKQLFCEAILLLAMYLILGVFRERGTKIKSRFITAHGAVLSRKAPLWDLRAMIWTQTLISEARGWMGKEGSNSTELCGYPLQISR